MIDIVIIGVLLFSVYRGYKKGFLNQLYSLISIILGYLISFMLTSKVAWLVSSFLPLEDNFIITPINDSLARLNIGQAYHKIIIFFVIFFLIRIILRLTFKSLGLVTKLPIIKTVNRFLGAIVGFLGMYIIVFVVIYVLYVLPLNLEWRANLTNSFLPNIIFENTPILSGLLLEEFFGYKK